MGEKVSIIVPVYNAEMYLNQCLESIHRQTYINLEIIVVFDLSEDNSLALCREWEKKDGRIRLVIKRQRNGLGAARNIGLSIATGKYIVYLDSDDWIAENYIMALYQAIEKSQANYVSSVGFYEVNSQNGDVQNVILLPAGDYESDIEKAVILLQDAPAVWKKIYNRRWLLENQLFQPELKCYEDWGYDISLVFQAEKITLIPHIGVFYRFGNYGKLSDNNMGIVCHGFKKSLEFGLEQSGHAGLLDKYRTVILRYILKDYYVRKDMSLSAHNEVALQILDQIKEDILLREFRYQYIDKYVKCICFGSFSLRWMVQKAFLSRYDMEYFGFSSLISAFTKGSKASVCNKSGFRVGQVQKDISGEFGSIFDYLNEKAILFVDFIEERNDIIELVAGQYITKSEAYKDSAIEGIIEKKKITSTSLKFVTLWKEKCIDFIRKLKKNENKLDVVLIKNRMALRYGDLSSIAYFSGQATLRRINQMICEMEDYFLDNCKYYKVPVIVFGLPEKYCFTDEKFKYGCSPQYMNEVLYTSLGIDIFEKYIKGNFGK